MIAGGGINSLQNERGMSTRALQPISRTANRRKARQRSSGTQPSWRPSCSLTKLLGRYPATETRQMTWLTLHRTSPCHCPSFEVPVGYIYSERACGFRSSDNTSARSLISLILHHLNSWDKQTSSNSSCSLLQKSHFCCCRHIRYSSADPLSTACTIRRLTRGSLVRQFMSSAPGGRLSRQDTVHPTPSSTWSSAHTRVPPWRRSHTRLVADSHRTAASPTATRPARAPPQWQMLSTAFIKGAPTPRLCLSATHRAARSWKTLCAAVPTQAPASPAQHHPFRRPRS